MSRLAVDPGVLAGAGVGLVGVGEGLGPAVSVVSAAFSANMGQDSAGVMFGRHYVEAGRGIMAAVAAGINALLRTGYGVGVSAVNYSRAEALSDLSGRAQPLALPPCPVGVVAAGGPSASGAGVAEPTLWAVVEVLVGDVWPSGSPAQMRIAAGAWRAFASVLHGISFEVSGPYNTVAAQEIPEGESITSVIRDIDTAFGRMARGCEELARAVEGFATGVENTQNAIRRLLARLGSIGSIVGIFFEFVRGRGEQDLEEIAADIRTVMGHLKSEADARKAQIEQALRDVEALNSAMQIVADREFTEFFGEDIGNALSEVWRAGSDIDRGIARWTASSVEGVEALDPTRFFYDPHGAFQTWKGLEQMAEVVTNPAADPELTKEIVKGLARTDEWKTQRPLTALTENALDVGTLVWGPEAAAGGVSKVGELGDIAKVADVADGSRLTGALGKLGEIPRPVGAVDEITTHTGQLAQELETTGLAPAGGKPVGGPVLDRPAGTPVPDQAGAPVVDKPAVAAVGDPKPVGGRPVSPDRPSGLPTSPVESKAVAAEPKGAETAGGAKTPVTDLRGAQLDTFDHPNEVLMDGHPPGAGSTGTEHPGGLTGGSASGEEPRAGVAGAGPPSGPRPGDHAGGVTGDGSQTEGPRGGRASTGDSVHSGPHDSVSSGDSPAGENASDSVYVSDGGGITPEKAAEILHMDKGTRPDPSEYLSQAYIENHLAKFSDGAARFMPGQNFDRYGLGNIDGTTFVLPKSEADSLIAAAGGDGEKIERALGLPEGFFDDGGALVRIDIPNPESFGLRMPSGNEAGANQMWLPGGLLPDGSAEAIIDGSGIPPEGYSVKPFDEPEE